MEATRVVKPAVRLWHIRGVSLKRLVVSGGIALLLGAGCGDDEKAKKAAPQVEKPPPAAPVFDASPPPAPADARPPEIEIPVLQ
jgi:hypothetical protein